MLKLGWVDTFRSFYPEEIKYTFWSSYGNSRQRNVGWRLDYALVNKNITNQVYDSRIMDQIFGSDHCPIEIDLDKKLFEKLNK